VAQSPSYSASRHASPSQPSLGRPELGLMRQSPYARHGQLTLGLSDVLRPPGPNGVRLQTRSRWKTYGSVHAASGAVVSKRLLSLPPLSAAENGPEILETNGRALRQMNHAAEACMSRCASGNSQWDASPRWATVGCRPPPLGTCSVAETPAPQFHLGTALTHRLARQRATRRSATSSPSLEIGACCVSASGNAAVAA
jgi:hypothetical protein